MIYVLLGVGLRTWNDWPNRVRWIFRIRGKVPKGLAILEPFGLFRERCVWPMGKGVLIRFNEEIVAIFAEFLPWLGIDEFLKRSLEFFFRRLFCTN